eukprot:3881962-Pyramimonas_sp.AAC.1
MSLMHAARMAVTPDILILPSDLSPCAKLVNLRQPMETSSAPAPADTPVEGMATDPEDNTNVVYINPGRLTKGSNGGTFVHVHLQALSPDSTQTEGQPHRADTRARVEIVKI